MIRYYYARSLTAFPVIVTITDEFNQSIAAAEYLAGSSVVLSCSATGAVGLVTYEWTSTCTGECFITSQSTQNTVIKDSIHSIDGGNHTCTITDDIGNSGSTTIQMHVAGTLALVIKDVY